MIELLLGLAIVVARANALTVPLKAVQPHFDPQKIETIYDMIINVQLHRGLMKFNSNLSIGPDLASSYEVLDSGKRLKFSLADRQFANGDKVRAIHVVRTFQRMFSRKAGFSADLDYILGARRLLEKDSPANRSQLGVKALDDRTVEFILDRPASVFIPHLASVEMSILNLNEKLELAADGAGAGPYGVETARKGAIRLKALGTPSPSTPQSIDLLEMTPSEALAAAKAGKVDSLDGYSISEKDIGELVAQGWSESVTTITRQLFLVQNPERVSPTLRKMIFELVMRRGDDFVPKPYVRSYGLIPNSLLGALPREEIKASHGAPAPSKGKVRLTIVDGEPVLKPLAESLKVLLAKSKVDLEIETIPLTQYMPRVKARDYDLMIRSKFLDYPDGMSILTYFRSHARDNTFFIEDPVVDRMLDQALSELDKSKRVELYKSIQKQILSHKIVVPVAFGSDNRGLWGPRVSMVPAHPLGLQGFPMETVRMK